MTREKTVQLACYKYEENEHITIGPLYNNLSIFPYSFKLLLIHIVVAAI